MDTKKFILLISAITAIVCAATVVYNFSSMPAYGGGDISEVPLYLNQPLAAGSTPDSAAVSGTATGAKPDTQTAPQAASSASPKASQSAKAASKTPPKPADSKVSHQASSSKAEKASRAGPKAPASYPVSLNSGTLEQIEEIPYIGPAKAQAIIDYRNAHGAFKSVDELDSVKGFGAATINKIRQYVTV